MRWWARRSRREKALLLLALLAVGGYLVGTFLVLPGLQEYARLQEQHDALQSQVERGLELSQQEPGMERQLQELRDEYRELEALLPMEEEIPALLSSLEDSFREEGVTLEFLQPLEPEVEGGMSYLPVELAFSGKMNDLQQVLYNLEDFPRYLQLTGADFSLPGGGEAEGELAFRVYYLRVPESLEEPADGDE